MFTPMPPVARTCLHDVNNGGNVQQAAPESLDIQRRMLNMVK